MAPEGPFNCYPMIMIASPYVNPYHPSRSYITIYHLLKR